MRFETDFKLMNQVRDIVKTLDMAHVDLTRVFVVRSKGSKAKRTIARCYALGKIWQKAMGVKSHYIIEVISERYDGLSEENKEKVLIHELMHIPKSMGGGFKHHGNWVTEAHVNEMHKQYKGRSF